MFTILRNAHFFPYTDVIRDEEPRYSLYAQPPMTEVPMLDHLLLEAMQDPTRNARYKLNAEKCAQIAQSFWLKVLPL